MDTRFSRHAVTLLLLFLAAASALRGQQPAAIESAEIGAGNRFVVKATVPAGNNFIALETATPAQAAAGPWQTMISRPLVNTSRASVTFYLPRQENAPALLARVRTGLAAAPPTGQLPDDSLITITYENTGPTVPEANKLALLRTAGAKIREWSALPRTERQASLIAWAKSNPDVADAYVNPIADNVCIEFRDGDTSILLNRQRTDGSTPPNLIPQGQSAVAGTQARGGTGAGTGSGPFTGLPENNTAVCAYSLEANVFPNSAPTIAGWLTAANYSTRTFSSTTVDEIKSWSSEGSPLGVLFWQAHGCMYGKNAGLSGVAVVTRQTATVELSQGVYKSMRDNKELLLAKDENETEPLYTVTSKFVKKYMKFAPHSLVVLDTCYAGHLELAGAFITAGAGAYASWDTEGGIASTTPILKIFDRLTGSNAEPPISTPPERPFSLPVIRMWMQMFQYDVDPSPKYAGQTVSNARLQWQTHPTTPAFILKPSVMRVLHEFASDDKPFTKFLIEGDFGTDPGTANRKVTWAGQEVHVEDWQPDGVLVRPPASPPAGNIQVSIRNRHHSNASPFTEWTVPFEYQLNGRGSLQYNIKMNVKIRAGIHGHRGMPEMPPQYLVHPFINLNDCTGQVAASGTYSPDPDTVIAWSGGSALHSVDPGTTGGIYLKHVITNSGSLNLLNGNIENFTLTSTGTFTETTDGQASEVTAAVAGFEFPPPPVRINLGSNQLIGDTRSFSAPDGSGSAKLSWPAVTPVAAPTNQTPR